MKNPLGFKEKAERVRKRPQPWREDINSRLSTLQQIRPCTDPTIFALHASFLGTHVAHSLALDISKKRAGTFPIRNYWADNCLRSWPGVVLSSFHQSVVGNDRPRSSYGV